MKTAYVLCFAQEVPHRGQQVVLIERQKKDWQLGCLNLPGGRMNPGETPIEAAYRELEEETGIVSSLPDIRLLGVMEGEDWIVHVCECPYRRHFNGYEQEAETQCDEGNILTMPWCDAKTDSRLIPNLRIVIPYCFARLEGWQLTPVSSGKREHDWITSLLPVGV